MKKFNLQKSKWRDKKVGDYVVVCNPVESNPVSEELKPWIGKIGFITKVNTSGCAGDTFDVQFINPLRSERFYSGELWWVKKPIQINWPVDRSEMLAIILFVLVSLNLILLIRLLWIGIL